MIRFLLPLLFVLCAALPAQAHKLKVFATVEENAIVGYAFFVGGGRAQGTDWIASAADGREIARGRTDDKGGYRVDLPEGTLTPVTITIDTHEGHVASASLSAERFGLVPADDARAAAPAPDAAGAIASSPAASPADEAALIAAAVQRQIAPLQEQIAEMDARLRYSDILSSVCLILGLAGMALYLRSRRT